MRSSRVVARAHYVPTRMENDGQPAVVTVNGNRLLPARLRFECRWLVALILICKQGVVGSSPIVSTV